MDHESKKSAAENSSTIEYASPRKPTPAEKANPRDANEPRLPLADWAALKIFGKALLFIIAGVVIAGLGGKANPWILTLGILIVIWTCVHYVILRPIMLKRESDAREWEEDDKLQAAKRKIVEDAKSMYPYGPVGMWRFVEGDKAVPFVTSRGHTMYRKHLIILLPGGRGEYEISITGAPEAAVKIFFEYKISGEGEFLGRTLSPVESEWKKVEWKFACNGLTNEALNLWLCLVSDNPFEEEAADSWPFLGEYERVAVPAL